jgi:hypothetical protein
VSRYASLVAGRTGLNLRALLLVGKELAKLAAILVVELFEVGVIDVKLLCAHCDGCEGAVSVGRGVNLVCCSFAFWLVQDF